MTDRYNVGGAVLVIGILWLGFQYGFSWWMTILSVLSIYLLLATWAYPGFKKLREELIESEIACNHAEADMNKAKEGYYGRLP